MTYLSCFTYIVYLFISTLQTLKFKAILIVRSVPVTEVRQPKKLIITPDPSIPQVDLACDDVLFNPVTSETQLTRKIDGLPWRGPKEKSDILMQLFVHGLSPKDGIVADLTASTGTIYPLLRPSLHLIFVPCSLFLFISLLQELLYGQLVHVTGTSWL